MRAVGERLRAPLKSPFPLTVARKALWARAFSSIMPIYLVNEYPKSGGTWLKNMLAAALDVPPWTRREPAWGASVMQAHWLNPFGLTNTVALFRDGRDVMVSYYFHSFFKNEHHNAEYVDRMRARFAFADYEDVRANLLPFMRLMLETPASPSFSWVDFVERWGCNRAKVTTTYEALRHDTPGELQRLVRELTGGELPLDRATAIAEHFSMASMRKRFADQADKAYEKPFVREGSLGGWTRHFTDEAVAYFEGRAGHALDLLGYARGRPEERR
jgi:hypothetical protein